MADLSVDGSHAIATASSDNNPPFSRVYVVCGKIFSDVALHEVFSPFGQVEYIKLIRDHVGESKGFGFVKFTKASDAARACEELHGRTLLPEVPPLKVTIADPKGVSSAPAVSAPQLVNPEEHPPRSRLYFVCKKEVTEEALRSLFAPFGDLEYVRIMREKATGASRGCGFVKYTRASTALTVLETLPSGAEHGVTVSLAQPKIALPLLGGSSSSSAAGGIRPQRTQQATPLQIMQMQSWGGSSTRSPGAGPTTPSGDYLSPLGPLPIPPFGSAVLGTGGTVPSPHPTSSTPSSALQPFPPHTPSDHVGGGGGIGGVFGGLGMGMGLGFGFGGGGGGMGSPIGAAIGPPRTRLFVRSSEIMTRDMLYLLFSRVPGLIDIDLKVDKRTGASKGFAFVTYQSEQAAMVAKDSFEGVEVAPGVRLSISLADPPKVYTEGPSRAQRGGPTLIEDTLGSQALASTGDHQVEDHLSRVFFKLSGPLPEAYLADLIGRIAPLVNIRMVGQTSSCGFAKFTTAAAAQLALPFLNGLDLNGTVKITSAVVADPPRTKDEQNLKKQRMT